MITSTIEFVIICDTHEYMTPWLNQTHHFDHMPYKNMLTWPMNIFVYAKRVIAQQTIHKRIVKKTIFATVKVGCYNTNWKNFKCLEGTNLIKRNICVETIICDKMSSFHYGIYF